jgi:uncharacterized protein YjiS (DUF1127 family)
MAYATTDWATPARRPKFGWIKSIFKSRTQDRSDRLDDEHLLRMNEHMLKDIGLTTDDFKEALMKQRRWL